MKLLREAVMESASNRQALPMRKAATTPDLPETSQSCCQVTPRSDFRAQAQTSLLSMQHPAQACPRASAQPSTTILP